MDEEKKLQEIGKKLNISEEDIRRIKKEQTRRKIIYPIYGALIIIASTFSGFILGITSPIFPIGYPYALIGMSSTTAISKRYKVSIIIITIILSALFFIITFITGMRLVPQTPREFGIYMAYGVYIRN